MNSLQFFSMASSSMHVIRWNVVWQSGIVAWSLLTVMLVSLVVFKKGPNHKMSVYIISRFGVFMSFAWNSLRNSHGVVDIP